MDPLPHLEGKEGAAALGMNILSMVSFSDVKKNKKNLHLHI